MKRTAKRQLQELLSGKEDREKLILIDEGQGIPKGFKGPVIRFVDFSKRNSKVTCSKL